MFAICASFPRVYRARFGDLLDAPSILRQVLRVVGSVVRLGLLHVLFCGNAHFDGIIARRIAKKIDTASQVKDLLPRRVRWGPMVSLERLGRLDPRPSHFVCISVRVFSMFTHVYTLESYIPIHRTLRDKTTRNKLVDNILRGSYLGAP